MRAGAALLALVAVQAAAADRFYGLFDEAAVYAYRHASEVVRGPPLRNKPRRGADEPPRVLGVSVYGGVSPVNDNEQPRARPAVLDGALRHRECAKGAPCDVAEDVKARRFDALEARHRVPYGGGAQAEFKAAQRGGAAAWLGTQASDANVGKDQVKEYFGHERRFRTGDDAFIFVTFDRPVRFWIPPAWRNANVTPTAFLRLNTAAHFGAVPPPRPSDGDDDDSPTPKHDEAVLAAGGFGTTKAFWKNDASHPMRGWRANPDVLRSSGRFPGALAPSQTTACKAAAQMRASSAAPPEDAFAGAAAYARSIERFTATGMPMPSVDHGGALRPSPWSRAASRYETLDEMAARSGGAAIANLLMSFYGMPLAIPPVDHGCVFEGDEQRVEQSMDSVLAFTYRVRPTDLARPLRPLHANALRLWPPGALLIEARSEDSQPYGAHDRCLRASAARGPGAALACGVDEGAGARLLDPFATEDDRREDRRRFGMGGGAEGASDGVAAARLRLPGFVAGAAEVAPAPAPGPGEAAGLRRDAMRAALDGMASVSVSDEAHYSRQPRRRAQAVLSGTLDTAMALDTPAASAGGAHVTHVAIEARSGAPDTPEGAGRAADTSGTPDVRGLAPGRAATVDFVVTFSEPVAAACGYLPSSFYALSESCSATYEESARVATLPLSLESEHGGGSVPGDGRTATTHPTNDRGCPYAAIELVTREARHLSFYGIDEPAHEVLSRGVGDVSERALDPRREFSFLKKREKVDARVPMAFGASSPQARSLSPLAWPPSPPQELLDVEPFQVVSVVDRRRLGYATLVNRLPSDLATQLRFRYRVRRGDNVSAIGWSSAGSLLVSTGEMAEDALLDTLVDADWEDAEEVGWNAQNLRGALANLRPRLTKAAAEAAWTTHGPRPGSDDCDGAVVACVGPPFAHAAVELSVAYSGSDADVYRGGAARWWRRRQVGHDEDAEWAARHARGAFMWAPGPSPDALRAYLTRARSRDAAEEADAHRVARAVHEAAGSVGVRLGVVHPDGHPLLGSALLYRLHDGAPVADLALPPPGFADARGTSAKRVGLRADF